MVESAALGGCLWTLMSRGPSITPTTVKLYHTSRRSQTSGILQVRTTCDIPERISKALTTLRLALDTRLPTHDRKHHKSIPLGSPDLLYTRMWRTLFRKMVNRRSLSSPQRIVDEERKYPSPRRGVRSTPTTKYLPHHHRIQTDPGDRHPCFFFFLRSFHSCFACRTELLWKVPFGGDWVL